MQPVVTVGAERPRLPSRRPRANAEAKLVVLGSSVTEIVYEVGAYLADRAREGWNVSVFASTEQHLRPLQILGVRPPLLGAATSPLSNRHSVTQIAVSANLLEGDELIYARVHAELSNNPSRVIVLGDKEIRGFENRLHVATYVPTAVGRVFKAHAMCAAGINADSLPPNEVFRRLASNAPVASSGVPRDDKASESQTVVRMPRGATP